MRLVLVVVGRCSGTSRKPCVDGLVQARVVVDDRPQVGQNLVSSSGPCHVAGTTDDHRWVSGDR